MRHAITTEIEIDVPTDTVWKLLTDLSRYHEWNPFITAAQGTIEVGERLVNRIEPPGGQAMTFKPTVTDVVPGRVFEWLGRLGLPGLFDGRHRFELSPTPSGGTRLVHSEQFSGLFVRPMLRSFDQPTQHGFRAMNEALKTRAESIRV